MSRKPLYMCASPGCVAVQDHGLMPDGSVAIFDQCADCRAVGIGTGEAALVTDETVRH